MFLSNNNFYFVWPWEGGIFYPFVENLTKGLCGEVELLVSETIFFRPLDRAQINGIIPQL